MVTQEQKRRAAKVAWQRARRMADRLNPGSVIFGVWVPNRELRRRWVPKEPESTKYGTLPEVDNRRLNRFVRAFR